MEVSHSLTDIPKIIFYFYFRKHFSPQFIEDSTSISILENHVSSFSLAVNIVTEKLDDGRVIELVVEDDLILGQLVNLDE